MLNERKKKILQIIIEDYISTAEPVGSRTIARKHDLGLSPARPCAFGTGIQVLCRFHD